MENKNEDVPLVEFMYLVFMPDEDYRRRLRSLLLYFCVAYFEHKLTPLCFIVVVVFSFIF